MMSNVTGLGNREAIEVYFCSRHWQGSGVAPHLFHMYRVYTVMYVPLAIMVSCSNILILIALHKDTSLHPPSKLLFRCLTTTDLCVGMLSLPVSITFLVSTTNELWKLCRITKYSIYVISTTLSGVSLATLSAISVDRLLALRLGLRYRQVVTIKRVRVAVILFWVKSFSVGLLYLWSMTVFFVVSAVLISLEIIVPTYSYTKIFRTIRRQQTQVHSSAHQGQANIAKYKKSVYSALWVHLTLATCFLPFAAATTLTAIRGVSPVSLLIEGIAVTLINTNSLLNPGLYCWKIKEVRRAVKEIIRQFCLCLPN